MFGGGEPPERRAAAFGTDAFRRSFRLHFYTGRNDQPDGDFDARVSAKKTAAWYVKAGFRVTTEWPARINHYNIPFAKIVAQQLGQPGR